MGAEKMISRFVQFIRFVWQSFWHLFFPTEEERKKEMLKNLFAKMAGWKNNSSDANLILYTRAVVLTGMNGKISSWNGLGNALGVRGCCKTSAIQPALGLRIAESIGLQPKKSADWNAIAEKLGLPNLTEATPSVPLTIAAFCELRSNGFV